MRVIIAGGRDFRPTLRWLGLVVSHLIELKATTIISGRARGADTFGERISAALCAKPALYPADWKLHGKAAGHIRNHQMAENADAVILLPGGAGTANMFATAQKLDLQIVDLRETSFD